MQTNIPNSEQEQQHLAAVKNTYEKLQEEIRLWQQEHASKIIANFPLASTSPFFTLDSLPEASILDLWQRLNKVVEEPLEEEDLPLLLKKFKNGEPLEDSISARLQLAFAGVAQVITQKLVPAPGEKYQPFGACPACGEKHFMTLLTPPVGKRYQRCLVCSYERPVNASGCACCGSMDAKKQTYLNSPEYPSIEVAICSDCDSYFKQVDLRNGMVEDLLWEDIRTLPLNYAAEKWLAEQAESLQ